MRENKFLRVTSYILIPILVLIIGISLFYLTAKDELLVENQYDSSFFESNDFLQAYMFRLSRESQNLIFHHKDFPITHSGSNC